MSEKEFIIQKGPLKGKRVVSAPQDEVEGLADQIDRVLDVIGHPEAYVTDLSSVSDFRHKIGEEHRYGPDDKTIEQLSEELGVAVGPNDLLTDIAERLSGRESN